MCTNLFKQFSGDFAGIISARTMDFGTIVKPVPVTLKPNVVAYPRNTQFPTHSKLLEIGEELVGLLPKKPLNWKNQYGFVGMDVGPYIADFLKVDIEKISPIFLDGMNEKGLSAATLWLDGSEYQDEADTDTNVMFLDVVAYILGTCANVSEAKAQLEQITVVSPIKFLNNYPAHYIFIDPDPNTTPLVVEYRDGKPNFYDVANGVLTNEPPYPEMLKAQEKYSDLSIYQDTKNDPPGLLGLPADSSPISRFARATKFCESVYQPSNLQEATTLLQVIIQNIEVPLGTVVEKGNDMVLDYSQWLVVRDHSNLLYYYASFDNQTLKRIDLNNIDFGLINESHYSIAEGAWFTDETRHLRL